MIGIKISGVISKFKKLKLSDTETYLFNPAPKEFHIKKWGINPKKLAKK